MAHPSRKHRPCEPESESQDSITLHLRPTRVESASISLSFDADVLPRRLELRLHPQVVGHSILHAKSSYALCMALSDAMLCWLSLHLTGFMHGDIDPDNVLLVKESTSTISNADWPSLLTLAALNLPDHETEPLTPIVGEIQALVSRLPVPRNLTAVLTGGEMAEWRTHFDRDEKSPSPEWMSLLLHRAIQDGDTSYIQSPVDDIQSFFWTAVWAVLFNVRNQERSPEEIKWQRSLEDAELSKKTNFVDWLGETFKFKDYSPVSVQLLPLLREWWELQKSLSKDWSKARSSIEDLSDDLQRQCYLHSFHLFALRGVKEYLALAEKYRPILQAYGEFAT
ncbi:hypothetical protein C8R46DRAFT_1074014 [Mycena filopes]|nr:hypothetical protein C8R46DRAFT_1074014 [Mycena filopes]